MFYGHNQVTAKMIHFGLLYNHFAVRDIKFCPTDCHVPTDSEVTTLESYLAANGYNYDGSTSGNKYAKALATLTDWTTSATEGVPGNTDYSEYRNKSNFSSLPSGSRLNTGVFSSFGIYSYLWTTTLSFGTSYYCRYIYYATVNVTRTFHDEKAGMPVRLIYTGSSSTVTDYDGNVYDVITIGTQKWLKQNWGCTHLNDGTTIPEVTNSTTWSTLSTGALCAYNNDWSNV